MSSGRILVADDEPSVRDSVGYALAQDGFEVTPVADGDEAAQRVGDGAGGSAARDTEKLIERLYAQIGELVVERDFFSRGSGGSDGRRRSG